MNLGQFFSIVKPIEHGSSLMQPDDLLLMKLKLLPFSPSILNHIPYFEYLPDGGARGKATLLQKQKVDSRVAILGF